MFDISSIDIFGMAFLIFVLMMFLDLKKGPIISNIFPLNFDDMFGPKILKIIKIIIIKIN